VASLEDLDCEANHLTKLDVSDNTYLRYLRCGYNNLTSLDVSNNSELRALLVSNYCGFSYETNKFNSLDLSENMKLQALGCCYLGLTDLDLSNTGKLESLACAGNLLTSLDLSNNPKLLDLNCSDNPLTNLDLSCNIYLGTDYGGYCPYGLEIQKMPSLTEVCVWTMPFPPTYLNVTMYDSPNINFITGCGSCPTGIDLNSPPELSVYPNPTDGFLTINTLTPGHYSIEITTLNGQGIFNGNIEGKTHQMDISAFQKGVYLLTIRSEDLTITEKIVKW
jgi:hypothetical protein